MIKKIVFTLLCGAIVLFLIWFFFFKKTGTDQSLLLEKEKEGLTKLIESEMNTPSPLQKKQIELVVQKDDSEKIRILKEILISKNDFDPRLDHEFQNLDRKQISELKDLYLQLPREALNERGTILFLLGPYLQSEKSEVDASFFENALLESPCLSAQDCSTEIREAHDSEDAHQDSYLEVGLVYPQLVALQSVDNLTDAKLKDRFKRSLEDLSRTAHPKLSAEAKKILKRWKD